MGVGRALAGPEASAEAREAQAAALRAGFLGLLGRQFLEVDLGDPDRALGRGPAAGGLALGVLLAGLLVLPGRLHALGAEATEALHHALDLVELGDQRGHLLRLGAAALGDAGPAGGV